MTQEEMEQALTYLLDREAIRDLVSTYCRGVDRLDLPLVKSVYHEDAIDDHGMFVGNRDEFADYVDDMHGTFHHSTQHLVANHLVEIDGESAHAETYFIWSGMNKEGAPFTSAGGRYFDRLEKRNGKWAIVARNCITDWVAPSINSVAMASTPEGRANFDCIRPYEQEIAASGPVATRDKNDPSYQRPLTIDSERVRKFRVLKEQSGNFPATRKNPAREAIDS